MMQWTIAGIAAAVQARQVTARQVTELALARIATGDAAIGAVVTLLADRALAEADALDARIARGEDPGVLAGVPFGVKALFDMAGLPTTAGAAIRSDAPPAPRDATLVRSLRAAGAIPLAVLNMDEFAYGFATVNAHFGTTHNPHDVTRLAGGSSGGSAAAVAAGFLPLTLGSDTNGSIRVPAGLCGVHGFRAAWGSVDMAGVFPFVDRLDVAGPFAGNVEDLAIAAAACGLMVAPDDGSPLRLARLAGWFAAEGDADFAAAFADIAAQWGGLAAVELADVPAARAAAFLITAARGGELHLPQLTRRFGDFDPATRDRFLAGCLLPRDLRERAEAQATQFGAGVLALFERFDVLLAPSTPCVAPPIAKPLMRWDGADVPARANLGVLTQPLSLSGCPVIAAPLLRPGRLPLGLQLIGAPGREGQLFAAAARLERLGITGFTPPAVPHHPDIAATQRTEGVL